MKPRSNHRRHVFQALALLCIAAVFGNGVLRAQHAGAEKRDTLAYQLRHFSTLADAAQSDLLDSAITRIDKGDTTLVPLLFSLYRRSDASIVESLGTEFSTLLIEKTQLFLRTLQTFPRTEWEQIVSGAFYGDGGGMTSEEFKKADHLLRKCEFGPDGSIASAAKYCRVVMKKVKKEIAENK